MSSMRAILLGLLTVLLLGAFGWSWMSQQKRARVNDYANLITETHGRAIEYFNEIRAQANTLNQAYATGGDVDSDLLLEAIEAHKKAAKKTTEEREQLAKVFAPPEAAALQKDALEYLDVRVKYAQTVAELLTLYEKGGRGVNVSQTEIERLFLQMQKDVLRMNSLAKDVASKKTDLLM